eukprot:6484834-Amphidinium_carterae.2
MPYAELPLIPRILGGRLKPAICPQRPVLGLSGSPHKTKPVLDGCCAKTLCSSPSIGPDPWGWYTTPLQPRLRPERRYGRPRHVLLEPLPSRATSQKICLPLVAWLVLDSEPPGCYWPMTATYPVRCHPAFHPGMLSWLPLNTCGPGVLASPTLMPGYLDQDTTRWRKLNPCAEAGEEGEERPVDDTRARLRDAVPGRVVKSVVSGASSSEVVAVSTSWTNIPSWTRGKTQPDCSTALAVWYAFSAALAALDTHEKANNDAGSSSHVLGKPCTQSCSCPLKVSRGVASRSRMTSKLSIGSSSSLCGAGVGTGAPDG